MPSFRVHYKTYFRHMSQAGHHDYSAESEIAALRMFFEERRVELEEEEEDASQLPDPNDLSLTKEYSWSEGEYLVDLRGVVEVDVVTCPLCDGIGEVDRALALRFSQVETR